MPAVLGLEPNDIVRTFGYIEYQAISRRTITGAIRPKTAVHSTSGKGTQTSHRPNLVRSGTEVIWADHPRSKHGLVWIAGEQMNEMGLRAVR